MDKGIKSKKDKDEFVKLVILGSVKNEFILNYSEWDYSENYGIWSGYYFKLINGEFKYYKFIQGD
jgi:hypothetical protein